MTAPAIDFDAIPDALPLGYEGRLFLLSWLHTDVICGRPITAESWRAAWGRAADYQTVVNGRAALAAMDAAVAS